MRYIRADQLKVGDVFYRTDNIYRNNDVNVVTGVGTAVEKYGWRKHKTRTVIPVATDEYHDAGWPLNVYLSRRRKFTFKENTGLWVNDD